MKKVDPLISLPSGMSSLCAMSLLKKGFRAAAVLPLSSLPFSRLHGLFLSFPH